MQLVLNGERHEHKGDGSLISLLREMNLDPGKAAVMINNEIIKREDQQAVILKESDKIELLTFAGGG